MNGCTGISFSCVGPFVYFQINVNAIKGVFNLTHCADDNGAKTEWGQTGLETPGGLSHCECGLRRTGTPFPASPWAPTARPLPQLRPSAGHDDAGGVVVRHLPPPLPVRPPAAGPRAEPHAAAAGESDRRTAEESWASGQQLIGRMLCVCVLEGRIFILKHLSAKFGSYFPYIFISYNIFCNCSLLQGRLSFYKMFFQRISLAWWF